MEVNLSKESLDTVLLEPQPLQRSDRLKLVDWVVPKILAARKEGVLALGLYGSLARGTDRAYSDIEIKCVLNSSGEDYTWEWVERECKIEVNFESEDVILDNAATVEEDWAITHGAYFDLKPLYGSSDFFVKLQKALQSPSPEEFAAAVREIIIGNVYEQIGKLRNSRLAGETEYLPLLAIEVAEQGALVLGLAHRKCYATRASVLPDSLQFDNRPEGYNSLCKIAMEGRLNDAEIVTTTLENFWAGLVKWARENHFNLEERCRIPLLK